MSESTSASVEAASKDLFFQQLGALADAMINAHGKEFAMGALILAARFIAEGKPTAMKESEPAG
ncbi:hypothetical protein PTE30175_04059 [Pandoraea terrae]|uniref:Uncharacterized protein n=1 Tax=Pandoraea terrae TaxID=1537710 RepID=A0A5E4XXQ7_9BURK|nr:hypothetical protein [Pandoraea terrae]VVE41023.1 hypothetical protein PTE30175_04059 [Pandoraea terrae]